METKTKAFTTLGLIIVAVIAIYFGIRMVGWLFKALLFGAGGFLIGAVFGAIWMKRRINKKDDPKPQSNTADA